MLIDLIFIFGVLVFVSCAFISILYILYRGAKEKKIRLPKGLAIVLLVSLFVTAVSAAIMYTRYEKVTTASLFKTNWDIYLPEPDTELCTASYGTSWNGDGLYYNVFKYDDLQEFESACDQWKDRDAGVYSDEEVRKAMQEIADRMDPADVPEEFRRIPECDECFSATREDNSWIYICVDRDSGLVYLGRDII